MSSKQVVRRRYRASQVSRTISVAIFCTGKPFTVSFCRLGWFIYVPRATPFLQLITKDKRQEGNKSSNTVIEQQYSIDIYVYEGH